MQIGANTSLLIAAQHARAAQPAKAAAPAASFEPLPLKQTQAPTQPAAPQANTPMQRPGSRLDIRV